jgi:hypothetical protein
VGGPVTTYAYQEEERNIFPRTVTTTETSRATSTSRALVIAGAGMRRKHSYDTGIVQLEDIEEVDSVLEKDSVLEQAFLEEEVDEEFPDIVVEEEEEDDNETLVEVDGELYKEKEVEIEVSDSEAGSDAESDAGPQDGCGVKRKRTIRVVIRSRAFI